jgi:hypothetical protein
MRRVGQGKNGVRRSLNRFPLGFHRRKFCGLLPGHKFRRQGTRESHRKNCGKCESRADFKGAGKKLGFVFPQQMPCRYSHNEKAGKNISR